MEKDRIEFVLHDRKDNELSVNERNIDYFRSVSCVGCNVAKFYLKDGTQIELMCDAEMDEFMDALNECLDRLSQGSSTGLKVESFAMLKKKHGDLKS
ncbi:MAG: hypothetical protein F4X44_00865 [Gammaproteobacteria bacterium]|nr:hypothetical protein [Gammaproteobacteria bacterium]MYD79154.1 hypothetical protein [Gammaproteobacteria bacterium]